VPRILTTATGVAAILAFGAVLAGPVQGARAQGVAGPYLAAEHAAQVGDLSEAASRYAQALTRDSENPVLLERAMTNQLASGQTLQAVALARRLQAVRPGQHLAVLILAADALRRGSAETVGPMFEVDVEEGGPFVGAIVGAWALYGSGEPALALAKLTDLEEAGTGGPAGQLMAAYHMGLIHALMGNDAEAVAAFERAVARSGSASLRFARAQAGALARLGRVEEARAVLEAQIVQTLSEPRLEALSRSLADGSLPEPIVTDAAEGAAEALYDISRYLMRGPNQIIGLSYSRLATVLAPDLVDAHLLIAETLQRQDQHTLAISAFEAVSEDAPEWTDARIGRATALDAAGKVDEAVATLNALVTRFPASIDSHTALGDLLRRNERFADAALAYDGAVALIEEPERRHWPLFYQRGISHERSDQWTRAEQDFRTALELEPDQPLVLNYLGYSWVDMGLNLTEAQAMIEKAVEQRPDDGYIVDSLGWVLYRLGDFEGAVEQLGRAVELRPVDPVINDHYGDALWMVGRQIEAEFQWHRAMSFEPDEKDASRIKRKLAVGLDVVQAEEAAAGKPSVIGRTDAGTTHQ
jgi:tetratricopeptide (TPR) repeat protein